MINKSIIDLNTDFYKKTQEQFSKTRQHPWKGWDKVLENLKKSLNKVETLSILDLGCGNGRFYKFLKNELTESEFRKIEFTGFDINEYFLAECKKHYPEANWEFVDIFSDLSDLTNKYDAVACFGVTHHVPKVEFNDWFDEVIDLVKENGIIYVSFWSPNKEITDNIHTWDLDEDKQRFVEIYELEYLETVLKEKVEILEKYENDSLNRYLILKVEAQPNRISG